VFDTIQRAAVFAAPCVVGADDNRDGMPTVLLESAALGTPCVSTDVTGIPEVIRHDHTGLIVPQHSPERLAEACERLLNDAALRVRLAGAARRLVEEEFDVARSTARLRDVFARCARRLQAETVEHGATAVSAIEPLQSFAEPVEAA
jgi:glycosyltransferase involved in cell wall biosynthesis